MHVLFRRQMFSFFIFDLIIINLKPQKIKMALHISQILRDWPEEITFKRGIGEFFPRIAIALSWRT